MAVPCTAGPEKNGRIADPCTGTKKKKLNKKLKHMMSD